MPPKAARPLNEEDIKFLGVAFKHLKEKPQVDFKSLAEELAMSAGGASNKFRDISRRLNELSGVNDGFSSNNQGKNSATGTKRKANGKAPPKTKKGDTKATDNMDSSDEAEPVNKKAKKETIKEEVVDGESDVSGDGSDGEQD